MSTALMTLAERVTFQLFDANGVNLVGNVFTLQVQDANPGVKQNKFDITNSESGGLAEFVPTIAVGSFRVEGIVDVSAYFALFGVPAQHVYTQMILYYTKIAAGVVNPLRHQAKLLWEDIQGHGKVDSNGAAWKFSASAMTIGAWQLLGVDTTGALTQGITAGF